MTGRAASTGPGHPHDTPQRRFIAGHDGGFHLRLSDLQAVADHVLGAEPFFVHVLTTGVASVRFNLSSRQHPSREPTVVNRPARIAPKTRPRIYSPKHLRAATNGYQVTHRA